MTCVSCWKHLHFWPDDLCFVLRKNTFTSGLMTLCFVLITHSLLTWWLVFRADNTSRLTGRPTAKLDWPIRPPDYPLSDKSAAGSVSAQPASHPVSTDQGPGLVIPAHSVTTVASCKEFTPQYASNNSSLLLIIIFPAALSGHVDNVVELFLQTDTWSQPALILPPTI